MQTISILVKGLVQGVYYRQSAQEKAISLEITGTVKNLPGGDVELIATGDAAQLKDLINWCRQGPARAIVREIKTNELPFQQFSDFRIIR
jgi:acylphosphatase